ncbi:hypothetical protein [Legionella gresilensis]|uniref:hypothetical protein n=1 Tax=Legionella gresilensis TaxID=91823 RepID=UPI001A94EBC1|nr:hypothetical protein [Legionella gresilensis]
MRYKVKSHLRAIIDDTKNELTASSGALMQELYDELVELEERLKKNRQQSKTDLQRKRLV